MGIARLVTSAAVGYLAGTFPSADTAARLGGVDLRREGSGNPGGMNVAKLLGNRMGYAVMGADIIKSALACAAGGRLAGAAGANLAGPASVIGHCYPIWNGFRGGKGVACSAGQMLATFPAYLPIDVALGVVMAKSEGWKARPTESTAAVCVLWTALSATWWRRNLPNLWGPTPSVGLPLAAATSSAIIIHKFIIQPDRTLPERRDEDRSP